MAAQRQVPKFEIPEVDEQTIYEDFSETVYNALDAAYGAYGFPDFFLTEERFKQYAHGWLIGNIAVHWSYKYLPAPPMLDHLLWIKAFVLLARVNEDVRLKTNRLFVALKQIQPTLGLNVSPEYVFPQDNDYTGHHVLSDLQADVNWSNFNSTFNKYFSAEASLLLTQFKTVDFPEAISLLTEKQLSKIFSKWEEHAPSLKSFLTESNGRKQI